MTTACQPRPSIKPRRPGAVTVEESEPTAMAALVTGLVLGCAVAAFLGSCLGWGWWQVLAVAVGTGLGGLAARAGSGGGIA